jgi:hypothetical protein
MAALKRRWRAKTSERGAELIEFALVLPLLLLLVLAIVDFGFLFQRLEVVTNAAREGARIAVLPGYLQQDVDARINNFLEAGGVPIVRGTNPAIDCNTVTLVVSGSTVLAEQVQVRYSHNYMFMSGLGGLFGGNFSTVPLTGVSTMRLEPGAGGC